MVSREFNHAMITDLLKWRQEAGWLVVFLGEGLNVAKQGVAMGAMAAHVATYSGSEGLRAAGRVAARSTIAYAKSVGDLWKARDEAAFTAEERDELAGKNKK